MFFFLLISKNLSYKLLMIFVQSKIQVSSEAVIAFIDFQSIIKECCYKWARSITLWSMIAQLDRCVTHSHVRRTGWSCFVDMAIIINLLYSSPHSQLGNYLHSQIKHFSNPCTHKSNPTTKFCYENHPKKLGEKTQTILSK